MSSALLDRVIQVAEQFVQQVDLTQCLLLLQDSLKMNNNSGVPLEVGHGYTHIQMKNRFQNHRIPSGIELFIINRWNKCNEPLFSSERTCLSALYYYIPGNFTKEAYLPFTDTQVFFY